jgi:hypothetical protein
MKSLVSYHNAQPSSGFFSTLANGTLTYTPIQTRKRGGQEREEDTKEMRTRKRGVQETEEDTKKRRTPRK